MGISIKFGRDVIAPEDIPAHTAVRASHQSLLQAGWENPHLARLLGPTWEGLTHEDRADRLYIDGWVMHLRLALHAQQMTPAEIVAALAGLLGTDAGRAYWAASAQHFEDHYEVEFVDLLKTATA